MPLETGTYVTDLVTSNPLGSDDVSKGDDHLRLIKQVLQNTLPDASRARYFEKVVSKSTTYTTVLADAETLFLVDATAGAVTINLLAAASYPTGTRIAVKKVDASANAVTIDANLSETIDGSLTRTLSTQYDVIVLRTNGVSWYVEAIIAQALGAITVTTVDLGNTTDTTLSRAAAGKLAVEGHTVLTADEVAQSLSGGARVTLHSNGTVSSGTLTPDPGNGPMQTATNNGAHTLAPGANYGNYLLDYVNGASAGAITTSGWTKVGGDSFTTTNAQKFRCHCAVNANGSTLIVFAMQ